MHHLVLDSRPLVRSNAAAMLPSNPQLELAGAPVLKEFSFVRQTGVQHRSLTVGAAVRSRPQLSCRGVRWTKTIGQ